MGDSRFQIGNVGGASEPRPLENGASTVREGRSPVLRSLTLPVSFGVGVLLLLAIFPIGFSGCRKQADYPSHPITLVCPWAVGGGTDRISRLVALYLEQDLGVRVNVVNVTGGGGVTGHRYGARARPDGYTLTMMTVELNMLHWRNLTHLSWQDFQPIALINQDAAALFALAGEKRWTDLSSLTRYISENPGQLTASGTATGGIWHLALAGWLDTAGLDPQAVRWIPMTGAGPSLQDLVSGGVDLVCCSLPEARVLLESGQVRSLGVMADERTASYENVPTFRELGSDWNMRAWRGIGVPAGTPPSITRKILESLESAFEGRTLVNSRSLPEILQGQGFNVTWAPIEEFAAKLARIDQVLGRLLEAKRFESLEQGSIGPMVFPVLVSAALLLSVLAAVFRSSLTSQPLERSAGGLRVCLEIGLLMVFFLLAVERTGFLEAGTALLFLALWRLGNRWWMSALVALVTMPLVYELFANRLGVVLPRGWLGW